MKITVRIFFCSLLFSVLLFAGEKNAVLNPTKIEVRLMNVIEAVKQNQPSVHSNILAKHSSTEPLFSVIVHSPSIEEAKAINVQPMSFNGRLYTARITLDQLVELSNFSSVSYIEAPRMRYPKLDKSLIDMKVDKVHLGQVNSTVYKGKNVIVGIIDSGIDWKHLDFRSDTDTTKSRILFLWDQTDGRAGIGPTGFNYGAEYDETEINNELDGSPAGFVQEQDFSGHGTHVASTAAGDGSTSAGKYKGVAPEADLIIVKAGDEGFLTTNIINGISYIRQKAVAAGKPFVINMSLGGHDGAHDGTASEEITVDTELNNAIGRQIVIAAGNEGSDSIHADGVVAQGGQKVLQFTVPTYTATSGTVNDYVVLSMWYKAGDNLTVSVSTPNNTTVTASSGQSQQQQATAQGFVRITNAFPGVNPNNSAKECYVEIYDNSAAQPPAVGVWTVTVTGATVTQGGVFDVWIGGSSITGNAGESVEFTSGATFTKLVGMPGTVEKGITVGAYVTKWSWKSIDNNTYTYSGTDRTNNFATFSSMGPTRDGRQKPDVSAPGQAIGAARSSAASFSNPVLLTPNGKYVIEQGTSMAAPHVAGLVALMLEAKPNLTSAQIRSAINTTARKDAFTGANATATAQWGSGKVDAQAALQTVLSVQKESENVPLDFVLQQNYPNPFNPSTKIQFAIPQRSFVTLKVYSMLGEEVATLVNDQIEPGEYSATFNADGLASGVYFYTLATGTSFISKKMMLVR